MATLGVSKPYVAVYANADGVVTYSLGTRLALATEVSPTFETPSDNNLYADNGIAETDKEFAGGTLTLGVDDLDNAGAKLILGLKENTITVGEESVKELVYDDDRVAPYRGFGCIVKKKKGGANMWRAVVLPKIMFNIPEDAATTQGESIEWQTPSIEGTIMRDDTVKHAWKREATFDTELAAEAYIKQVLDITVGGAGE